jgi:hypothetical protein
VSHPKKVEATAFILAVSRASANKANSADAKSRANDFQRCASFLNGFRNEQFPKERDNRWK